MICQGAIPQLFCVGPFYFPQSSPVAWPNRQYSDSTVEINSKLWGGGPHGGAVGCREGMRD